MIMNDLHDLTPGFLSDFSSYSHSHAYRLLLGSKYHLPQGICTCFDLCSYSCHYTTATIQILKEVPFMMIPASIVQIHHLRGCEKTSWSFSACNFTYVLEFTTTVHQMHVDFYSTSRKFFKIMLHELRIYFPLQLFPQSWGSAWYITAHLVCISWANEWINFPSVLFRIFNFPLLQAFSYFTTFETLNCSIISMFPAVWAILILDAKVQCQRLWNS